MCYGVIQLHTTRSTGKEPGTTEKKNRLEKREKIEKLKVTN